MGVMQTKFCAAQVDRQTNYWSVVRVEVCREISDVMVVFEQSFTSTSISNRRMPTLVGGCELCVCVPVLVCVIPLFNAHILSPERSALHHVI